MRVAFVAAVALGALAGTASVQAQPDPNKVLRVSFPIAETGFDPQSSGDAYSNYVNRAIYDPLYKYVLRQFVGFIVQKRFNLSWSIEGTRSRTGKMLPPKLGLLAYVADAYLDGRSEDILLQPVSISFDQLHETAEYAAYARGGEKTPEGLSWLYNYIKAQGERSYGKIYVRFPEAVSMREYLGEPGGPISQDDAAKRLAMQKMAFEVSWRILRATPVNATGLVSAR